MSKLTVEEARGVEALQALREEWQALFRASGAPPFLSWEWIAAWQAWFGRGKTPRVFCAREAGRLIGLLPLYEEQRRPSLLPWRVRRLAFLGERFGGADYLDVLALPETGRQVAGAIFEYLAKDDAFDLLDLDGLAADAPSLPLLAWRFEESGRFTCRLSTRFVCPQVRLAGAWEQVLKRSRRADNFKRRLRHLRTLDGFDRRVIKGPEEAADAFDRFRMLHEKRWAEHGGSSLTGHPTLMTFHRDVVQRLSHAGLLRFEELWVEGACRASIYGIEAGEKFYFLNSGYDPDWAKASVGLVCLGLSIEDAVQRGVRCYDFLAGIESYKFDWANETRATVAVQVVNHNLAAMLVSSGEQIEASLRAVAKALLPAKAKEFFRRWRRARQWGQGLVHNGRGLETREQNGSTTRPSEGPGAIDPSGSITTSPQLPISIPSPDPWPPTPGP